MPFTTTFATLSARGFGLFGKKLNLTTVTFPSGTTSWTAPPGVSNLVVAVGKGADGTSDFADPNPTVIPGGARVGATGSSGTFSTLDWSTLYNAMTPYASSGGVRSQDNLVLDWAIGTNDLLTTSSPINNYSYTLPDAVYGTTSVVAYRQFGGTLPPTSGQVLYSFFSTPGGGEAGFKLEVYYYYYGGPGAATTAFGQTFPGGAYSGGTGYPATDTTFTNVAVIPGTTYTIVNNGALTIQYYV